MAAASLWPCCCCLTLPAALSMSLDDGMKALEPLMALRAVTDGEEQKSKIVVVVVLISSKAASSVDAILDLGFRSGCVLATSFTCSFVHSFSSLVSSSFLCFI